MDIDHYYRLGNSYKDTGGNIKIGDQFLRWINIPGSGMLNSPGIRPLKFIHLDSCFNPASLILVTHTKKRGHNNPWEDSIDLPTSTILYWGDAKFHPVKKHNDFPGNKVLEKIWHLILEDKRQLIPPILHFSKPKKGVVIFNGLCVLTKLELTWFEDRGHPVRNFRAHFTILNIDEISISWLHDRSGCRSVDSLNTNAPKIWRNYLKGKIRHPSFIGLHFLKKSRLL